MADRDLLLHDAKNCLHVLTVNLEAIEDGVIPLTESCISNLNESLFTFQKILQQLLREDAPSLATGKHCVEEAVPSTLAIQGCFEEVAPSASAKENYYRESSSADSAAHECIDIIPLFKRVVAESKPLFDKRGISFSFEIEATGIWIMADATRFERLLHNLFSNEEKYVQPGGVVSGTLKTADGSRAVLTLMDNGPGIKPQYLNAIFRRSQRGINSAGSEPIPIDEQPGNQNDTKTVPNDLVEQTEVSGNHNDTNTIPNDLAEKSKRRNGGEVGAHLCKGSRALHNTHKTAEGGPPQGLGLGLYQVEQTVSSFGGFIEVENRATGGLQISLSFPMDAFLA